VRDGRRATAVAERVLASDPASWNRSVADLPGIVARRLEARLRARPAPRGPTTVVFAPGVAGVLIHELVGHALEADALLAGTWASRAGEGAVAPGVTVVDDPRRGRTAWRVDDEGETARPTLLMRDGRVAGSLVDLRTAALGGRKPTGHGRRASFREPVRPRMGCTFLAAGKLHPGDVLDGTTGIYVWRLEAASVDPASGTAVLRVTDADLLDQGRTVVALQPHLLRVDAARALPAIDRIADDLAFDTCVGSCQRQAQALAVSVGAPTIRSGVITVVT
jgi:TldD protein